MSSSVQLLFDRLLPSSIEPVLAGALGRRVPRLGPDDAFRISSCGRFSGRIAADLLAYAKNQEYDGAFVLIQEEVTRVLYVAKGVVIGAESNVLFERLGRVLLRLGHLTSDDARHVVSVEESRDTEAAASMLPPEVACLGLDRRAWEVGTALTFMGASHFLLVDGAPDLGALPRLAISTMDLAIEGVRRYDEWRNAAQKPSAPTDESKADLEAAPQSKPRPAAGAHDVRSDVDEIMRLLRE
jgi:hypothetical protein